MDAKIITGKKNVWKYILSVAVFIFIIVLSDFLLGNILQHFYFTAKSGTQYRTTFAIEKTKADIIIFGSSRAVAHYKPSVFEERYKLTYYNAGRDGEYNVFYHYALLKAILHRYTPKIVILDLMPGELEKTTESYEKLAFLSPYYSKHPEMRSIITLRSSTEKLKMLSKIYQFNSTVMNVISGNLNLDKDVYFSGYSPIPSTNIITKPIATIDNGRIYDLDSNKTKILRALINDCKEANIKLYIACSPIYYKFTGTEHSILRTKSLAATYNVDFFDFSRDSFFLQSPKLFYNELHLNDSGAKIFSNKLLDKIELAENPEQVTLR